ncbi:hypothetical protein [Janthinobacterium sp. SUN120]|uniref:hypothetical protein n=1 Tax=Janthinobacterium sp. SUN120 TaxID=3004099 RepID=UPI0025B00D3C|nr:hypothetical protein [Janthinobacterium sp. SUN120]MDN2716931.1 hypothetical protein [Janthinobacterium sp. SUN120]
MTFQHGNNSVFSNIAMFLKWHFFNAALRYMLSAGVLKWRSFVDVRVSTNTFFCGADPAMLRCGKYSQRRERTLPRVARMLRLFARRTEYALSLRLFPARQDSGATGGKQGIDLARMDWFWRWNPVSQEEASTSAPIRCDR